MNGITQMLRRRCKTPAVYWGNPKVDGFNQVTYDTPVELLTRWTDVEQVIISEKSETILSRSTVHLLQDVDYDGVLYLGTLESLEDYMDSDSYVDPKDIPGTYIIKRREAIPSLRDDAKVFKAYLTPYLS